MPSALIVDDDPRTAVLLANVFENRGFATRCANSLAEARGSLDPTPDICLVEMRLPDGNGMELLADGLAGRTDVVMLTGCETAESSVEALRRGARDYLTKPLSRDAIDRILARFDNGADHGEARPAPSEIVGESPEMKRVLQALARIGRSEATVLIIGESGTGKELVAARLHELSPRSQARYLTLNCGAVSPNLIESELFGHEKGSFTGATRQHAGYFERAHGGTLFLDEITEMPLELQVRLLLVLESRRVTRVGSSEAIPIDVRVIAATNRDPSAAVREGKLREDLLYRLQVVPIEVPPLRMRSGDVRLLASHFLTELNRAAMGCKARRSGSADLLRCASASRLPRWSGVSSFTPCAIAGLRTKRLACSASAPRRCTTSCGSTSPAIEWRGSFRPCPRKSRGTECDDACRRSRGGVRGRPFGGKSWLSRSPISRQHIKKRTIVIRALVANLARLTAFRRDADSVHPHHLVGDVVADIRRGRARVNDDCPLGPHRASRFQLQGLGGAGDEQHRSRPGGTHHQSAHKDCSFASLP